MAKNKIASKGGDQFMLRFTPGLRTRIAKRAADNGRSINTEIIDAIEQYLLQSDRISQMWDFYETLRKERSDRAGA
jgi:hypothetical protein